MLVLQVSGDLFVLLLGRLAEARLGVVGVLLLFLIGVALRARRPGLATVTATLFALLMIQA